MGRKNKFSKEIKLKAKKDYQDEHKSMIQIADELGCNDNFMSKRINIRLLKLYTLQRH